MNPIKSKILADIESLEKNNNCGTEEFIEAKRIAYRQVRDAIAAIPEYTNADLEKEAESYWNAQGGGSHAQWDRYIAVVKYFTKWQKFNNPLKSES